MTTPRKRILVVGCGAIGAIFAARLSTVADVVAYDVNAEHVRQINAHGLRVTGNTDSVTHPRAVATPQELGKSAFDAIILLTKSGQTGQAVQSLLPRLEGEPLWVTLQNGMGNSEILMQIPGAKVARGVTMNAGRYVGPGHIEHLILGVGTWIGPIRGGIEDCRWLTDLMTVSGIPAEAIDDPMEAVWSKFVFNCVMNPVGALLLGVNAARYEVAEVRDLIDDMAAETIEVVKALGAKLAFDPMDFVKKIRSGAIPITRHAGSMSLDIQRGAATEIEELTGFIVREGDRLGIPVPISRTLYRLVKGLERARALQ